MSVYVCVDTRRVIVNLIWFTHVHAEIYNGSYLANGAQSSQASTDSHSSKAHFCDGSVDDAPRSVLLVQSSGDLVCTVVLCDFLSHQQYPLISLELLVQGSVESITNSDLSIHGNWKIVINIKISIDIVIIIKWAQRTKSSFNKPGLWQQCLWKIFWSAEFRGSWRRSVRFIAFVSFPFRSVTHTYREIDKLVTMISQLWISWYIWHLFWYFNNNNNNNIL